MTKEALIKILKGLLKAEKADLDFLLELKKADLQQLVAIVRERVENNG